jgi:hypothetical protein
LINPPPDFKKRRLAPASLVLSLFDSRLRHRSQAPNISIFVAMQRCGIWSGQGAHGGAYLLGIFARMPRLSGLLHRAHDFLWISMFVIFYRVEFRWRGGDAAGTNWRPQSFEGLNGVLQ